MMFVVIYDRAMLRPLANRVWMLHTRPVTVFDGTFAEWEVASAEREHAAAVRATEEQALRRVEEKKRTARRESSAAPAARRQLRDVRTRAERAEAEVTALEGEVESLTHTLDDPGLYTKA